MSPQTLSQWMVHAVVLGGATLFGYQGLYLPAQATVAQTHTKLVEDRSTQALRVEVAEQLQHIAAMDHQASIQASTEWLMNEIVQQAQEQHVRLDVVTPLPQTPWKDQATEFKVQLRFAAPYHQVGQFVSALESNLKFLRVDSLDMSRQEDGDQVTASVQMTIAMLAFPSADVLSSDAPSSVSR